MIPQTWDECTPSDDTADNLPVTACGFYVGDGGAGKDVSAVSLNGSATVFKNVPSGSIIPGTWVRINSTGTDAGDILFAFG